MVSCPSNSDIFCYEYQYTIDGETGPSPIFFPCTGTDPSDGFDMLTTAIRDCPEFDTSSFIIVQDDEYGGGIGSQDGLRFCVDSEHSSTTVETGLICVESDCIENVKVANICYEDDAMPLTTMAPGVNMTTTVAQQENVTTTSDVYVNMTTTEADITTTAEVNETGIHPTIPSYPYCCLNNTADQSTNCRGFTMQSCLDHASDCFWSCDARLDMFAPRRLEVLRTFIGISDFSGSSEPDDEVDEMQFTEEPQTIPSMIESESYLSVDPYGVQYSYTLEELSLKTMYQNEIEDSSSTDNDTDALTALRRRMYLYGDDDRVQYTSHATQSFPENVVGKLTYSNGTHVWYCSATLIGPWHILLAGHCLYDAQNGAWYGDFKFYPNYDVTSDGVSIGWQLAVTLRGWTDNRDHNYDIGMIVLARNAFHGWMSFGYDEALADRAETTTWNMIGFPADLGKRTKMSVECAIEEYHENCLVDRDCDLGIYELQADGEEFNGAKGTSGGPVWSWKTSGATSKRVIYAARSYSNEEGMLDNVYW
eukprot:CAMPEP_0202696774 /NCGR_PEP_ID=MMETSP1385-20130828/10095_1 /ASSEMBLY_ACC=CAM_ASM_000861 /TAXON_ID=933848 /ORGANISM="Elphidium margaritaceum" /LENGTH=534 /DNA_ID=CAMNT_0049353051 /DNA_START=143 /DNA_END=1744 /DNA_ORIENTATION=-